MSVSNKLERTTGRRSLDIYNADNRKIGHVEEMTSVVSTPHPHSQYSDVEGCPTCIRQGHHGGGGAPGLAAKSSISSLSRKPPPRTQTPEPYELLSVVVVATETPSEPEPAGAPLAAPPEKVEKVRRAPPAVICLRL